LVVLSCLAVLCASASVSAQTETGVITGTVTDQSGAVLPGVTVTLSSTALIGGVHTTTTNAMGLYKFIALPPGSYDVKFELSGFSAITRPGIRITANFVAKVDTSLGVQNVAETVTVSGQAPIVDSKSSLIATSLDKGLLDNIPTGRDIWVLTEEVAGTVPDRYNIGGTQSAQQSLMSIHGATAQQDYSINGLSMNWPGGAGNYTMFYFDYDSFDEVQIESAGAPAEVSVGGLYMNMITKSGSADFHGGVTAMWEPGQLQGNNVTDAMKAEGITTANPIDHIVDFEPVLGGPITKNAWFFGSYRMYIIDTQILGLPAGQNVDINHQSNVLGKVTTQLNPKNKLMVQYYFNYQNRFYRRDNGYSYTTQQASWRQIEPAHLIQGQWTSVLSKSLFLDTRFGYLHQIFPLAPQSNVSSGVSLIDDIYSTVSGAAPDYQTNLATRHQANASLSYFNDHLLGGTHDVKFGFELARALNGYDYYANGDMDAHFDAGVPAYVVTYNTPMYQQSNIQNLAFYAQDAYAVRHFTVNFGVRFENFKGWNPPQGASGGTFYGPRQFAEQDDIPNMSITVPRVGVSYDVFGDGRTALKASYSRYAIQEGSRFPETLNPNALSGDTRLWTDLNGDGIPELNELSAPVSYYGGASGITLDPNISRQYSDEITAGLQHQLGKDLGVSVTYYHRRNKNLLGQVNNAIPSDGYTPVQEPLPDGSTITVYNLLPQYVGLIPQREITNIPWMYETYNGLELTLRKRLSDKWQAYIGYTRSKATSNYVEVPWNFVDANDPNNLVNINGRVLGNDVPNILKASGTYFLPWGLSLSGNYRYYTGSPLVPTLTVNLNQGPVTVFTNLRGETRYPSVSLLDFRLSKIFSVGQHAKIETMLNLYNAFNASTVTSEVTTVGPSLGTPTAILTPIVVGVGAHLTF
jgi:hypothetical protein